MVLRLPFGVTSVPFKYRVPSSSEVMVQNFVAAPALGSLVLPNLFVPPNYHADSFVIESRQRREWLEDFRQVTNSTHLLEPHKEPKDIVKIVNKIKVLNSP